MHMLVSEIMRSVSLASLFLSISTSIYFLSYYLCLAVISFHCTTSKTTMKLRKEVKGQVGHKGHIEDDEAAENSHKTTVE